MRNILAARGFLVAGAVLTALVMGQSTASAAEVQEQPTPESVAALQTDLENEGVSPTVADSDGVLTKRYDVTQGGPRVVIETTEEGTVPPGTVQPRIRAGVGNGIYIYLNNAEQQALVAGGANVIAGAICAIPAVGQAGCIGAVGAANAAAAYLNARGSICGNELEINYLSFPNPTPRFKCV